MIELQAEQRLRHEDSATVVGFDGFREGWLGCAWRGPGSSGSAIRLESLRSAESQLKPEPLAIAVDIPLGLLESGTRGGRKCDQEARKLLGPRASSVFPPPVSIALAATTYGEACELNRGSSSDSLALSKQSFALFPKLIDARDAVAASDWLRKRIIEVHPEVCFASMAGTPLRNPKKKTDGKEERRRLLKNVGFEYLQAFEDDARQLKAATDDALDACAAAWSAWRRTTGSARYLPVDSMEPAYSMRIWY